MANPISTGTATGTSTATVAAAGAASDKPWWARQKETPPVLDRAMTTAAIQQCNAEVGKCQLVAQMDEAEAGRLRASGAQYSPVRARACARALELLATAPERAAAVELDRQAGDIAELGMVRRTHEALEASYSLTAAKRQVLLMDDVRDYEEQILLLGAQERQKASPNANILAAASLIQDARLQDSTRKQSTQKDHESRVADKDVEITQLKSDMAHLQKMNEELLQGLAREKAERLASEASAALGSDRRQGGR